MYRTPQLVASPVKLVKITVARIMALLGLMVLLSVQAAAYMPDEGRLLEFIEHQEQSRARLNLTEEQEERIAPIIEASRDKRLAILETYGFGQGSKPKLSLRKKISLAKEMKAVREDTESALSRHLTPAQMEEYRKIQEENRQRMKEVINSR